MPEAITTDQRDSLLQVAESYFCDLKAKEIKSAKLSETISAICNASGGEIFIGIAEENKGGKKKRHWDGFADEEAANPIFQTLNDIAPLADFIDATFFSCEGEAGLVLKLELRKNAAITKATT